MRKINKKIIYVVMALAMLALLIPAVAAPVSAAGSLSMYLLSPVGTNPAGPDVTGLTPDSGFDITGSSVRVIPVGISPLTVTGWNITNFNIPLPGHADAVITAQAIGAEGVAFVDVRGGFGPAVITATLSDGSSIYIDKKFAQIDSTVISDNQNIPVTWVEADKTFIATANVSDTVLGTFVSKDGTLEPNPVQGVILHWFLIDGNAASNMGGISMATGEEPAVESYISGLPRTTFTTIDSGPGVIVVSPTEAITVSGPDGGSGINLTATGEESVDVVVVPEYPNLGNVLVTPEVTKVNFWTQEMEKVPQVRWAGEKIILEKFWGPNFDTTTNTSGTGNYAVKFSLENQSGGTLSMVGPNIIGPFAASNFVNTTQTVWAPVDDGTSSVCLEDQDEGVVSVTATLYTLLPNTAEEYPSEHDLQIVNQHGFVVYFLKLESLTLGNVPGKRADENSGLFIPSNPWDASKDVTTETLNVSTDALLRARVKGWFTSSNPTTRLAGAIDINNTPTNPNDDLLLPAGRWVLPDDWPMLAGTHDWQEFRLHWDIMDNPYDNVMSASTDPPVDLAIKTPPAADNYGTGNYYNGPVLVAAYPVIGPFSPGIELMTPTGWAVPNPRTDEDNMRQFSTVVPNGVLDWWDAPMPPAKITFEINNVNATNEDGVSIGNAGYFKPAMKTDIYYVMIGATKFYTNPFYQEMIPAHEWIPAFINNGGYDWDSFNLTQYGPYPFWYIINRLAGVVPTSNMDYPTKVQVYSDNHGEAMVWLNGDWNLDPLLWGPKGLDIPVGTDVGNTVVQAAADYPYFRIHQAIWSNIVTKTWEWGGEVLQNVLSVGAYGNVSGSAPNEIGTSNDKLVLVWATDRDGKIDGVLGTKVQWDLDPSVGVSISNVTTTTVVGPPLAGGVSNYNDTMHQINIVNGFLDVAPGTVTDGTRFHGVSYLRAPSPAEMALFAKLYPAKDPTAYAVAGIDLVDASGTNFMGTKDTTVTETLTGPDFDAFTLIYGQNANFTLPYPLDDNIVFGDANNDGVVTMADVTAVERMILGLSAANIMADANAKDGINMGDVVKIERTILGLK